MKTVGLLWYKTMVSSETNLLQPEPSLQTSLKHKVHGGETALELENLTLRFCPLLSSKFFFFRMVLLQMFSPFLSLQQNGINTDVFPYPTSRGYLSHACSKTLSNKNQNFRYILNVRDSQKSLYILAMFFSSECLYQDTKELKTLLHLT